MKVLCYVILLFGPCLCTKPRSREIDRYLLHAGAKELIPYSEDQALFFEHSGGGKANLKVKRITNENTRIGVDDCAGAYNVHERQAYFLNGYPFDITLILDATDSTGGVINVAVNKYHFIIPFNNDFNFRCSDLTTCYSTLQINNTGYTDVVECLSPYEHRGIYPYTIWYNRTHGLLQITMSNGESYTLLP